MSEKKEISTPQELDAKWDASIDYTLRRVTYSSLAGAFAGLLFFRSPVARRVSLAYGAGIGTGLAYSECSRIFDGSPQNIVSPKISDTPVSQDAEN